MPIKVHPSFAVHPGLWLKAEIVDANGIAVGTLADRFHVSRQALSALLNGRSALSSDMAIRFEKAFGLVADTLMRMQLAHEMAQVRAREHEIHVDSLIAAV